MRKLAFVLYAWGSTFLFGLVIYWLATIPDFQAGTRVTDEVIKVIFRMVLYAILFILLYRSVIITLKSTVERLSKWRSRQEEHEDAEFVLIIETLVVILTIFICIFFAFFEEHTQFYTRGRNGSEFVVTGSQTTVSNDDNIIYIDRGVIDEANKDILVSVMSILLSAIVVYSIPVIGELEVAIKHKIEREVGSKRKSKE